MTSTRMDRGRDGGGSAPSSSMIKIFGSGFLIGALVVLIGTQQSPRRNSVLTPFHERENQTRPSEIAPQVASVKPHTANDEPKSARRQPNGTTAMTEHLETVFKQHCNKIRSTDGIEILSKGTKTVMTHFDIANVDIFCRCNPSLDANGPNTLNGIRSSDGSTRGLIPFKCTTACSCGPTSPPPLSTTAAKSLVNDDAKKRCKARGAKDSILLHIDGTKIRESTDASAEAYCICAKPDKVKGPGSIMPVDFGPWPVQQNFSVFPAACGVNDCRCYSEKKKPLESRRFSLFNVNVGLGSNQKIIYGNTTSDDEFKKLFPSSRKKAPFLDMVSLTTDKDLDVLLKDEGMLSMFKHFKNLNSLTFILPEKSVEPVLAALKEQPEKYSAGSAIPGSSNTVPPIHLAIESLFEPLAKTFGSPYSKVVQQFMKLHVFDMEHVGDHVLIVDSDTVWGMDVQWVHPNGSMQYFYFEENPACTGMYPVNFVNSILTTQDYLPLEKTGKPCSLDFCSYTTDDAHWRETTVDKAQNHIMHHMVFERSIMAALHETVIKHWGGSTFWEAAMKCWHGSEFCRGRVAEYEVYFTFSSCYAPEKMMLQKAVDVNTIQKSSVGDQIIFAGAAGHCDIPEMKKCREGYKNFLVKGCHNHRKGQTIGNC